MGVLVFGPTVQNEANPFEAFNSFLVLKVFTCEVAAWKTDFLQILGKCLVIAIHADDPVDNFGPEVKSVRVADEKVVFVEDLQHFGFQSFYEKNSCAFQDVVEDLWCAFCEDHVMSVLILNHWQNYVKPFIGSHNDPVGFLGQVCVLKDFQAELFQYLEAVKSVLIFEFNIVTRSDIFQHFFVGVVPFFGFEFVNFVDCWR